jgi:hypothetical protein
MPVTDSINSDSYQATRLRAKKARAVEFLGGRCVDCGATDKLQFDHVSYEGDGRPISMLLHRRWETVERELAFCELRCASCHSHKTNRSLRGFST